MANEGPLPPEFIGKIIGQNIQKGRSSASQGQFSNWPMATDKFLRHVSDRHHEFEDTMARMYLQVTPGFWDQFLEDLPDEQTRNIARVLASDGEGNGGFGYIDFILGSANHAFTEKMQVSETLADNYVAFFFCQAPPVFAYSGTVYNTLQDNWTPAMIRIFMNLGRGTALARRGLIFYLKYSDMIVGGAMTNLNWSLTSVRESAVQFSFQFLVKKIYLLNELNTTVGEGLVGSNWVPTNLADITSAAIASDEVLAELKEDAYTSYVRGSGGEPEGTSDASDDVWNDEGDPSGW